MDASAESPWTYVLLPTGAALIITIFYRRGMLSAQVLEERPRPNVPLTSIDLLPVAALWVAGALAASGIVQMFSAFGTSTQPESQPFQSSSDPALMKNLLLMLLQVVIQLPMVLFVFGALLVRNPDAGLTQSSPTTSPPAGKRLLAGLHQFGLLVPDSSNPIPLVRMGLVALVTAIPIVFGINQISVGIGELLGHHAPESGHKLLDDFGGAPSTLAITVLLTSVAFVAPVLEEFVYRGLLQSCLRGVGSRWQTVLIAAAVFALMHISVVPFQVLPGLFALGVMLGWLYERTGSLWPGIILHSGFNLANVVLYYLVTQFAHTPTTQPTL